jgi:DNA invertase Pin-like site-specific DNA recombinase
MSLEAIAYLRQSLDRTGDELGISRQREDAEKLAAARGWTVREVVAENDTSAAGRRRRPGFERVLAALRSGEVGGVIAWDMSRLTRNARDTLAILEAGQAAGAVLAFVRGSDLDLGTPAGRLTAAILASVALHEIEQKSDRQRRATDQAARAGHRVGGRRPFGYEPDGTTVRESEAAALRSAYEGLLGGLSLGRLAGDLNAAGARTSQAGGPWSAQILRPVLRSPRYAGIRAVGHGAGSAKRWEEVAPADWPGLVPEETFRAACALLDRRERTSGRGPVRLLTGLALCGVCGGPVHGGAAAARAGGHPTYRCRTSLGHLARSAAPVDAFVGAVAVERLSRPDAPELLADRDRPDAAGLAREAASVRSRLESLAADYGSGLLGRAEWLAAREAATRRLADVERRQADAGRVDVLGPLVRARNLPRLWDRLDVDRRRSVIKILMSITLLPPGRGRRTFDPETVVIDWL